MLLNLHSLLQAKGGKLEGIRLILLENYRMGWQSVGNVVGETKQHIQENIKAIVFDFGCRGEQKDQGWRVRCDLWGVYLDTVNVLELALSRIMLLGTQHLDRQ